MGKKEEKLKIGILYVSLHNLLKKRHGVNMIVTRKELFCELGKHFLIPKNLKNVVIKEMENLKLIERKDRDNLIILKCEYDLEKDVGRFYKDLGLY